MKLVTKGLIATSVLTLGLLVGTSFCLAEEDKPEADLTVGAYSQYIWRGYELSKDSVVIQPSMTVSYKGFAANVWGNMDTDLDSRLYPTNSDGSIEDSFNMNEIDLTLSYDGSVGMLGYSVGWIYYDLDGFEDTQEVYVGLSFDTLLSPSITYYDDIANIPGWYATFGISHSFPVTENIGLDLGAQIGYLDDDADYNEFHDGILSAALSIPVNDYITVAPELYWSFPLSSKAEDFYESNSVEGDDSFVYGGVSISFAF